MYNRTIKTSNTRRRQRRRGTARLFVLGAAFLASTATQSRAAVPVQAAQVSSSTDANRAAQSPDSRSLRFDIAAAPLADVLAAFEQLTRITVFLTNNAIADIQSPGVVGTLTANEALQQLLSGTSVAFSFTARDAVTLELRAAGEFVAVSADRPGISSPQFTEPLRNIPQTITVIPSSVIESQGATTLRDVLRNVTGISIQAGEGGVPAGDNLSIRGFSARTDFFIDGVRDVGGYTRDPFNVEQVEVLKGPSSSVAGRGSTGGVINLATKAPHLAASRNVSLGIGSSDFKRGTIDVNQPVGALENAAFRLNAMWNDSDTPGRDAVTNERWGIAPSLAFGIGTPTRVTADYTHLRPAEPSGLRDSVGAQHERAASGVRRQGTTGRLRQFLRVDVPRLRRHKDRRRDDANRARFQCGAQHAINSSSGPDDARLPDYIPTIREQRHHDDPPNRLEIARSVGCHRGEPDRRDVSLSHGSRLARPCNGSRTCARDVGELESY